MTSGGKVRKLGVEEEFQLVDLDTRRLVSRAEDILAALPPDIYVAEMQRFVVESNSSVFSDLSELRDNLLKNRRTLSATAERFGVGVAAAGTMPLSIPADLQVTETPRYRRMLADYQLLAREQLICGTQVHVDVVDRDEAVRVARRLEPWIPLLLALSCSSPYWSDGSDTGYASARTLVWQRWPTAGPAAPVSSAAEYDALIEQLVASGVITDPGMVYFDIRPSAHLNTLELRICDSCSSVETIAAIAGLFRALVVREAELLAAGLPPIASMQAPMVRAAIWQAARSGMEGELIDPLTGRPRRASDLLLELTEALRPQLEESGDYALICDLVHHALRIGSSASRQRRVMRRRGLLTDVVDLMVAETAGQPSAALLPLEGGSMLLGYRRLDRDELPASGSPAYDEAIDERGEPRPLYADVLGAVDRIGPVSLRRMQYAVEREQGRQGVTFRATGSPRANVFPLDLIPRVVTAEVWQELADGLGQRAKALNAFLRDIYGAQQIIGDRILPPELLDRAPGFRSIGRMPRWQTVRNHISGFDLVNTGPGEFSVLEDNLRVPSGIGYAMANRAMMDQFGADVPHPGELLSTESIPQLIFDTLRAAAPPGADGDPHVVLVSSGSTDSAWFEHTMIAERAGMPLLGTDDLVARDGCIYWRKRGKERRIDVIYLRMEEDMLLTSSDGEGNRLRQGIVDAIGSGNLSLVNALGNGVADDKAIYVFVPAMIEYYLGEKPLLPQIPTWLCAERDQRDFVLANLDQLVVKPIDGFGGTGITIGPSATEQELDARRAELLANPERFIAQEVLKLSTHPTFDGEGLHPHHMDLRVFIHLRAQGEDIESLIVPGALTRVAPAGSLIVNSSRGGGGKDTWILHH
ncbi:glutamate--cysteine ligase [Naumannella halotolerans]|uniref:glutamate--cysteine ligase n=1 Tax=Naumannella halotolerans TaxID=993414 RepID=UPI00370DAAC5